MRPASWLGIWLWPFFNSILFFSILSIWLAAARPARLRWRLNRRLLAFTLHPIQPFPQPPLQHGHTARPRRAQLSHDCAAPAAAVHPRIAHRVRNSRARVCTTCGGNAATTVSRPSSCATGYAAAFCGRKAPVLVHAVSGVRGLSAGRPPRDAPRRRFRAPEPFFRDWPDEPRPSLSRRLSPAFDQASSSRTTCRPP